MLYLPSLAITKFNDNLLTTGAGSIATVIARRSLTDAWSRVTLGTCGFLAGARVTVALTADLWTLAGKEATVVAGDRVAGTGSVSTGLTVFRR